MVHTMPAYYDETEYEKGKNYKNYMKNWKKLM